MLKSAYPRNLSATFQQQEEREGDVWNLLTPTT
jgi:hypothetical protein